MTSDLEEKGLHRKGLDYSMIQATKMMIISFSLPYTQGSIRKKFKSGTLNGWDGGLMRINSLWNSLKNEHISDIQRRYPLIAGEASGWQKIYRKNVSP